MAEKTEKKPINKKIVVDEAKVREAKKKVNDLLQGTGMEDPIDNGVFVPPTNEDANDFAYSNSDNATTWLSEQVAGLTQQVEQLQKANQTLQIENSNLMTSLSTGSASIGSVQNMSISEKNKIIELYKHFESIYSGKNSRAGGAFDTVKFSNPQYGNGVLDMFISTFPFLQDLKDYRHRG